jgi:hypothetical protein
LFIATGYFAGVPVGRFAGLRMAWLASCTVADLRRIRPSNEPMPGGEQVPHRPIHVGFAGRSATCVFTRLLVLAACLLAACGTQLGEEQPPNIEKVLYVAYTQVTELLALRATSVP